jgi:hypothetical protein
MNPYGDPPYNSAYAHQQPYASTSAAPPPPPPRDGGAPSYPPPPDAPPSLYGGTTTLAATASDPGLPPLLHPGAASYSTQPYSGSGSSDDPVVVHPLNPLKGDWTTRIDLATTNQQPFLPPGGTIILPSGNAIPKQLAGGTELVKVTGKVRALDNDIRVSGLTLPRPVLRQLSHAQSQSQSHGGLSLPYIERPLTSRAGPQCDRRYPECSRCLKRKETCDYGEDVSMCVRVRSNKGLLGRD